MCWYQLDHTNKNYKTNPGIPLPKPVLRDLWGGGEHSLFNPTMQLLTPAQCCRHCPESLSRKVKAGAEGVAAL